MPSKILYDARTNEIKQSQIRPHGSASLPSLNSLCRSARIPEDDKEYMKTTIINNDYLTNKAKKELRIVNDKAIKKPKIKISVDKKEIEISKNPKFTINVELENVIEDDSFASVDMSINDVEFKIEIQDNEGNKTIELFESDTYVISCADDRFVSRPVEVESVE